MKILNKTIKEISVLLDQKKISSVELTKEVFKHIRKTEPKIKAFITLTEKEAMEQARESDERRERGESRSVIDGVPISVKDILCTKDIKTTAGAKMLADFLPPYDATVVSRLKNAGAVIIGKNNCDAWAHGGSGENSQFGPTKNPWDLSRVPGGSSSGSAASVAAGMGFASFGTDTGGSIRQPAGFCGVTGLKPTYGRCSRYGLIAMASSLDCPGAITRSAEDAAILLEIICGHDPLDSTTISKKKFSTKNIENCKLKIKNLRIGLPKEYFAKGLDAKVKEKVMEAVKVLEKFGAKIININLPNTDYALAVYYIIQPAEVSSNLARYDGIKYGYSIEKTLNSKFEILNKSKVQNPKSKTILDVYFQSRARGFGDEAKRRIMIGTYVLSAGYYEAYYKKAMQVRTLVRRDFDRAFEKVDIIITPTSPTTAFKLGEKTSDPLEMYLADIYTVSANIAGLPGISVPCGFVENVTKGYEKLPRVTKSYERKVTNCNQMQPLVTIRNLLPAGMQILGPQFSEEKILSVAYNYQQVTDWHTISPKL